MSAFCERHYFFRLFPFRRDDLQPRLPEGSDLLPRLPRNSLFESQGRTKPEITKYTTHILYCYA